MAGSSSSSSDAPLLAKRHIARVVHSASDSNKSSRKVWSKRLPRKPRACKPRALQRDMPHANPIKEPKTKPRAAQAAAPGLKPKAGSRLTASGQHSLPDVDALAYRLSLGRSNEVLAMLKSTGLFRLDDSGAVPQVHGHVRHAMGLAGHTAW